MSFKWKNHTSRHIKLCMSLHTLVTVFVLRFIKIVDFRRGNISSGVDRVRDRR